MNNEQHMSNRAMDNSEATQVANGQRLLDQQAQLAKGRMERLMVLSEVYPSLPAKAQLAIVQLVYEAMRR